LADEFLEYIYKTGAGVKDLAIYCPNLHSNYNI